MKTVAVKENATGSGPILASLVVDEAKTYNLISVSLNLDVAPTTSESFTITLDADAGAVYDTLLYTNDLSVGSVTDILWMPDQPILLEGGDAVDVAYANTDGRLYGLQITAERRYP